MNPPVSLLKAIKRTYYYYNFPYRRHLKKNKCIFIHIPKNAGSSILSALGKSKPESGRDHLPWYVYYTANVGLFESFYKFSFIRNPWDRTYSAYCFLRKGGNKSPTDLAVAQSISIFRSFDDFVINGLGEGFFRSQLVFLPQSEFIIGPNNKVMVDFVGRQETIDEDFHEVAKVIGITNPLPKLNVSSGQDTYREAYRSDKSVEIVSRIYQQDVNFFGYDF